MKSYRIITLCALFLGMSWHLANAATQGETSPDCMLNALNNATRYDLQQFRGKVVYVDFWASWCAPCAKSFPFLNSVYKKYQPRGLQVLAINMDEQPELAKDFLSKYPAEFPIATDLVGQCAENFAVEAMPSSYLIDKKGIIRHVHFGFRPDEAEKLHGLLEQLLAESGN